MQSVILKFDGKLTQIGQKTKDYNTPIVDVEKFLVDYLVEKNKIIKPSKYSYFSFTRKEINGRMCLMRNDPDERDICSRFSCFRTQNVLEFNTNDIDLKDVVENKYLILAKRNLDAVILERYQIKNMELKSFDELRILFNEGLIFIYNKKELTLQEIEFFFKDALACNDYQDLIKGLICNNHLKEIALKDLTMEYLLHMKRICCDYHSLNLYNTIEFYYYIADLKFMYLFEYNSKNNIDVSELTSKNPVYTGKPYDDVKTMAKVSSVSMEIINSINFRDDVAESIKIFAKLEANSKIGVNGIKLIKEVNDNVKKIDFKDAPWRLYSGIRNRLIFEDIDVIMNTFDINLKTFLERAVKSIFLEQIPLEDYIVTVIDYIEMKQALGLTLENKLPKNVIELHNILKEQIRDVTEQQTKENFKIKAKENKIFAESFNNISKDKSFLIVSPEESKDLIKEGQEMHHCVGSYIERFANGYSKIFFIRLKENPEQAFVTIELDNKNNLIQAKGRFNTEINKETSRYINEFIKFMGGRIDE